MKRLLRLLPYLRRLTGGTLVYVGFALFLLLGVGSYVYMTTGIVDGNVDFSGSMSLWGGKSTCLYAGILVVFVATHIFPYALRFRNWWVHTESRKPTREAYLYILGRV